MRKSLLFGPVIGLLTLVSNVGKAEQDEQPTPSPEPATHSPLESEGEAPVAAIWLRTGSMLLGSTVEYTKGQRIVLMLPTGEVRTISWSDVERIQWVKGKAPSIPPAPRDVQAPTTKKPERLVKIHLVSDTSSVVLEQRESANHPWQPLCRPPCGSEFALEGKHLRVSGPGLSASKAFTIAGQGTEHLQVRAGGQQTHDWGERLLIGGLVGAFASGLAFGLGRYHHSDAVQIGGAAGLAVSGVSLGISLPLLQMGNTTVHSRSGDRVGARDHQGPM